MMIEKRQKTVTVYSADGEEFNKRNDAVEAVLRRALGGYLTGNRDVLTIQNFVKVLNESAFRFTLGELIALIDSNGNK